MNTQTYVVYNTCMYVTCIIYVFMTILMYMSPLLTDHRGPPSPSIDVVRSAELRINDNTSYAVM